MNFKIFKYSKINLMIIMKAKCKILPERNWSLFWSGQYFVICTDDAWTRCMPSGKKISKKSVNIEKMLESLFKDEVNNEQFYDGKSLALHHSDVDWSEIDTFQRLSNNRCINWVLLGATGEIIDSNDPIRIGSLVKIR